MWHSPNQRVRATATAKKRERERSRKPLHIRRISAQIQAHGTPTQPSAQSNVRIVLNDLTLQGVGVYSPLPLPAGREIVLQMDDPKPLTLRGKVVWCQEVSAGSHILSTQVFSHRIGIQFILSTEEEQSLKDVIQDL